MNPQQNKKADELESADLASLTRESFRYPVEPVDSEAIWQQTLNGDGFASWHRWSNALHYVFWASLGLFIAGVVVRFKGEKSTALYAIWLWNILATAFIFRAVRRLKVSVFDAYVYEAFEQARACPTPWLMMRWLGEAFHYVKFSPCFFKVFYIAEADRGIKSPNSFDHMRHQLRVAAVHALRTFQATAFAGDKRPYDSVLDGLLNKVPRLKYRWVIAPENMSWAIFAMNFVEPLLFFPG